MELRALSLAAACLILPMCSTPPTVPQLSHGMTQAEVTALWGPPKSKEPRKGGGESWFYTFAHTTTRQETQQIAPPEPRDALTRHVASQSEQTWSVSMSPVSTDRTYLDDLEFNSSGRLIGIPRAKRSALEN